MYKESDPQLVSNHQLFSYQIESELDCLNKLKEFVQQLSNIEKNFEKNSITNEDHFFLHLIQ